jgi:hypothetical protein
MCGLDRLIPALGVGSDPEAGAGSEEAELAAGVEAGRGEAEEGAAAGAASGADMGADYAWRSGQGNAIGRVIAIFTVREPVATVFSAPKL